MATRIPDSVDSTDAFATALKSVVEAAHENDVDVEGGWFIETGEDGPDWDVEIWAVEEDTDD
jgi:hypothetical protein